MTSGNVFALGFLVCLIRVRSDVMDPVQGFEITNHSFLAVAEFLPTFSRWQNGHFLPTYAYCPHSHRV